LKDLIAGRSSLPSWRAGATFSARSRTCRIEGKPDEARLAFPLWATGAKATVFAVAPCGGSARALWTKLVRDFGRREDIVALEQIVKNKREPQTARDEAARRLEAMAACKLGRVG